MFPLALLKVSYIVQKISMVKPSTISFTKHSLTAYVVLYLEVPSTSKVIIWQLPSHPLSRMSDPKLKYLTQGRQVHVLALGW